LRLRLSWLSLLSWNTLQTQCDSLCEKSLLVLLFLTLGGNSRLSSLRHRLVLLLLLCLFLF
jgi:hypothetical protein